MNWHAVMLPVAGPTTGQQRTGPADSHAHEVEQGAELLTGQFAGPAAGQVAEPDRPDPCLLYTSDAADD